MCRFFFTNFFTVRGWYHSHQMLLTVKVDNFHYIFRRVDAQLRISKVHIILFYLLILFLEFELYKIGTECTDTKYQGKGVMSVEKCYRSCKNYTFFWFHAYGRRKANCKSETECWCGCFTVKFAAGEECKTLPGFHHFDL